MLLQEGSRQFFILFFCIFWRWYPPPHLYLWDSSWELSLSSANGRQGSRNANRISFLIVDIHSCSHLPNSLARIEKGEQVSQRQKATQIPNLDEFSPGLPAPSVPFFKPVLNGWVEILTSQVLWLLIGWIRGKRQYIPITSGVLVLQRDLTPQWSKQS